LNLQVDAVVVVVAEVVEVVVAVEAKATTKEALELP
jgi:hypothetical protein